MGNLHALYAEVSPILGISKATQIWANASPGAGIQ